MSSCMAVVRTPNFHLWEDAAKTISPYRMFVTKRQEMYRFNINYIYLHKYTMNCAYLSPAKIYYCFVFPCSHTI